MTLDEKRRKGNRTRKRKAERRAKAPRPVTPTSCASRAEHPRIHDGLAVTLVSYEITEEPMPDAAFDRLPDNVQDRINTLHDELQRIRPNQALEALRELIKKYPDVAQLYNYLYIACYKMGQREEATRVAQETLRRFPDYLFGRLSLSEEYLNRGELGRIAEIFAGKFDLKLQYPRRNRFHLTEVMGFQSIVARYYFALGNHALALRYYEVMREICPEHPTTRYVGRVLWRVRIRTWVTQHFHSFWKHL